MRLYREEYTDLEWFNKMRAFKESLPQEYCDIFDRHGEIADEYDDIMNVNVYVTMRSLSEISREISASWKNVYFGAAPYLNAMRELDTIDDTYVFDSAESVVRYFLSNAKTWRGDDARRIKKELNGMLN